MSNNITWEQIQGDPKKLLEMENITEELAELTFDAHGTEWFKQCMADGTKHEIVQIVAVRRRPELIRWCIHPTVKTLATAVMIEPKWMWVARANKKSKEVEKYIEEIQKKPITTTVDDITDFVCKVKDWFRRKVLGF